MFRRLPGHPASHHQRKEKYLPLRLGWMAYVIYGNAVPRACRDATLPGSRCNRVACSGVGGPLAGGRGTHPPFLYHIPSEQRGGGHIPAPHVSRPLIPRSTRDRRAAPGKVICPWREAPIRRTALAGLQLTCSWNREHPVPRGLVVSWRPRPKISFPCQSGIPSEPRKGHKLRCRVGWLEGGGYLFFFSRERGDSAKVKTTISSPVVVLMSWWRLTTLTPVTSKTVDSRTGRAVSIS